MRNLAAFAGLALLATLPARAHHSVAAEFDPSKQTELKGEITQVWFANPHVRYRLAVTNADGTTEDWELQGGNVTGLLRQGWTADSLRVGDRVTASGDVGWNDAKKLRIREVVTTDGRVVPTRNRPAQNRDTIVASADHDYTYHPGARKYPVDITGSWRNDTFFHFRLELCLVPG